MQTLHMEQPQTIQGSSPGSFYWEAVQNAALQLQPILKPLISVGKALQKTLNRGNERKEHNNPELRTLCHTINSKYYEHVYNHLCLRCSEKQI